MRILFVESDVQRARELHSHLLSYRGVRWDLVHAADLSEAHGWLDREHFDAVLLSLLSEGTDKDYETFVGHVVHSPVVAMLSPKAMERCAPLVRRGVEDCVPGPAQDGGALMRRLRLATARYHRNESAIRVSSNCQPRHESTVAVMEGDAASESFDALAESQSDTRIDYEQAWKSEGPLSVVWIEGAEAWNSSNLDHSIPQPHPLIRVHKSERADLTGLATDSDCRMSAVIAQQSLLEKSGIEGIQNLRNEVAGAPMIMLMADRADTTSVNCVESGVEDCLPTSSSSWEDIHRSIRMAWARKARIRERIEQSLANHPETKDRRAKPRGSGDRRRTGRYLVTHPLMAIPVLPNDAPDKSGICEAFTIDVSTRGVGFQVASRQVLPSRNWVIGIEYEAPDTGHCSWHFASVTVSNTSYAPGGIRLGTEFVSAMDDLLRPEQLMPQLDTHTHHLLPTLPMAALEDWIEVGVLRKTLMNRIATCPECSAIVVNGKGCRECGGPQIEYQELIHHFACAYVGHADEFHTSHGLCCPKCATRGLVVGADFEVIKAVYSCRHCGFEGSEIEQIGTCLQCQLRFPLRMANEQEVYGYDVDRLDILAFLNSAT